MNSFSGLEETPIRRREFLLGLSKSVALSMAVPAGGFLCNAAEGLKIPVVIFSKAYQPLKLSFEQAAEFTSDAGLDGVDPPVRPDGEIKPERAADELPAYVEALRKQGRSMPYLTTAITSTESPHAEVILRTAKKLGVQRYRLGFMFRSETSWEQQLREVRAHLKDLAALNKEIGIGSVLQNHSPSGHSYVGGNLDELSQIVEGFEAEQLGVAFDIAHALNVHGAGWRQRFDKLKAHLKVVYVKDTNEEKHFVRLGQGLIGGTGDFDLLKRMDYRAPISLHIEYSAKGTPPPETRAELLQAVKGSLQVLRGWLA